MIRTAMFIAIGFTLVACAREADRSADTATVSPPTSAAPTEVERAVAVKRGIDAAPGKADSVLSANGLTAAGFDSLMYRIAADSALRAAYASASRD